MLVCGIDEAGRGPVVGPLVIAGAAIEDKDISKLGRIGVKDSKLLTPKQREELFDKIKEAVHAYEIIIISPAEIDEAVKSDHDNLNWLEGKRSAEIINKLNPARVYLDCPSPNLGAFKSYMLKLIENKKAEVVCEHKADYKYFVVGAASILAKVTRDDEIKKIKEQIGIDFGSGYTSDPVTQEFVKKNWHKYPSIFRHSWTTYKNEVEKMKQWTLGDFED